MLQILKTIRLISVKFLITGLFLFSAFSCTDHETAIFYFVANESQLVGNNLTTGMTIHAMTATANNNFYYLAAGPSILVKPVTDGSWHSVSLPSGSDISTGAAAFRPATGLERLYVGFANGLFFTEQVSGENAVTWLQVAALGNKQVTQLKVLNNNLVVALLDIGSSTNSLFYRSDTDDTFHPVSGLQNLPTTINDFTFDGSSYWATSGSTLYNGQLGGTMQPVTAQPPSDDTLMGIIFTAAHNYYVSTDNGQVFLSNDGINWVACNLSGISTSVVTIEQKNVPFRFIGQAPSIFNAPNVFGHVLVGSFGFGFFTIPDGSTVLTRIPVFTITPLFAGVVNNFFIDDSQVFVLTVGSGLWVNTYTPGVGFDSNWLQE